MQDEVVAKLNWDIELEQPNPPPTAAAPKQVGLTPLQQAEVAL